MQRRLGRRDYLLLTVVSIAFLVLAVQLPYGTRGFDHPQQGGHWRLLEAPGRALGWGGVALLIIGIPYALLAWLKGRTPGRAISALGALVFGIGIGGLSGVLASTPAAGGGVAGGALAHMLSDSLGSGFASVLFILIAVPGLFLSLAPLLLDTGYVSISRSPAATGTAMGEAAGTAMGAATGTASAGGPVAGATVGSPAGGVRGAGGRSGGSKNLPPVLVKPWYPERHVGPDGEELPMNLGGSDVGPIRYRDPPPEPHPADRAPSTAGVGTPGVASGFAPSEPLESAPESQSLPASVARAAPTPSSAGRTPIPKATPLAAPTYAGTKKPPVISGVRYRDEETLPPPPLTQPRSQQEPESDEHLPEGVRFAPVSGAPPSTESVADAPEPIVVPVDAALPLAAVPLAAVPLAAVPAASDILEATFLPDPEALKPDPATGRSRLDDVVVASWVASHPLPVPDPVEPSPPPRVEPDDEESLEAANSIASGPASVRLHPSVVGHRRKLAESGIFEGTSPAADRPGRTPKPKPKPSAAKDWREALHGLFSSLPVEELPPIRVPDDLVGASAAEDAAARVDAPGQMRLFDASDTSADGRSPDGRAAGTRDALFDASVDAALERGTASLVLLKRKLGVGYARAASLMDALVAEGVLGEMTASGSRPTLLTQAEWNRRKKR